MTFDEFLKLAVATSDIRVIPGVGDGYEYCSEPVSGVVFMSRVTKPGEDDVTLRFDTHGYVTQNKNGTWNVQIECTEKDFASFHQAARYLWDEWVDLEVNGPKFVLVVISIAGNIIEKIQCQNGDHAREAAINLDCMPTNNVCYWHERVNSTLGDQTSSVLRLPSGVTLVTIPLYGGSNGSTTE